MKRETSDRQVLDILAVILQDTPDTITDPTLNRIASLVRETGRVTWPTRGAGFKLAGQGTPDGPYAHRRKL